MVERYAAFVYFSAFRRLGTAYLATEATRSVFLVLARRAGRLPTKTVLAGWLFHVTDIACRKLGRKTQRASHWRWFEGKPANLLIPELPLWARVAPKLDAALARLPDAQRDAVLLYILLGHSHEVAAQILRTNERRAGRRVESGLKKITRRLRRQHAITETESLTTACIHDFHTVAVPEGLTTAILDSIDQSLGKRPPDKLARRILFSLGWARWRRRFAIGVTSFIVLLLTVIVAVWQIEGRTGYSRLVSTFLVWAVKHDAKSAPGLAIPARPWPAKVNSLKPDATSVRTVQDLYRTTNIWLAHLRFTQEQWAAMEPKRIEPLPHFMQSDGTVMLRNPEAQRSGLAGVLGFDFDWAHADLEFGGIMFTNVAARIKGNGTFLGSLYGDKRPLKVDLNKFAKGQKLGDADGFTFNNLINDYSCLSDALAYELYRAAGVPASRTAYAYVSASVNGQWTRKPLGLYAMIEPVDETFALERFGSKRAPVFKPVTYELFQHLGDDWPAYEAIYDLKTKATEAQQRRVIEFARLMTFASDAEFAEQLGDFLDLEKFARYLACEVLLSNYDGFLSNGQNFYLYLHPVSNKFGFIPWDLDLAWGGFFLIGTARERERARIWHPWVGEHRFLERVMGVDEFRQLYRAQLEDLLARLFIPSRLNSRIDEVARATRGPIAAESDFRLGKFEQAVSDQRREPLPDENDQGANRPAHQLKHFIEARARSVREQLDGKSKGIVLERHRRK